jgi:putative chitinase
MSNDRQKQVLLDAYTAGITSPAELANYMAQVTHESLDLNRLNEGFKYTRNIDQIPVQSAFRNGRKELEEARLEALQGKPEHLGELMYGGRMGNTDSGDGYKYHGRGYVQLTGKDQYAAAGKALGLNLVEHPELAAEPANASKIAVAYWKANVHGTARENVAAATRVINNGDNGLKDRQERFADWKGKLTPEVMAGLAKGEVVLPTAMNHHGVLRQGTQGESVRDLQTKLGQLGYASADGKVIKADGSFGPGTRDFVKAFQHDNHLKPDGVVGPGTLQAIDAKLKERVAPSQQGQITDAHHAGNALYKQAKSGLEKIDAEFGRKPDQLTDNAAAAIAVAALRGGLTRIDHMTLGGNDNSTIFAIQGKPGAALSKFVDVPTVESMHTPVAQSSQAFTVGQQAQQTQQQAPQQNSQQAAQQTAPAMSR